jgi:hypothetical protein
MTVWEMLALIPPLGRFFLAWFVIVAFVGGTALFLHWVDKGSEE